MKKFKYGRLMWGQEWPNTDISNYVTIVQAMKIMTERHGFPVTWARLRYGCAHKLIPQVYKFGNTWLINKSWAENTQLPPPSKWIGNKRQ